jgi:hypothetical protein
MNIYNIIIYYLNIINGYNKCKYYIHQNEYKTIETNKCKYFVMDDNYVDFYFDETK